MESQFAGFAPDSFAFFRELARNNNKPWFDLNRERYERHDEHDDLAWVQERIERVIPRAGEGQT